ncbi:DNaJ domain (Prokaryotic heat shock protein) [Trichostrongylus colubriformis]|uniref:DNaJ domain (Prokaryotic heat shock protein) n=1 Tax=Trichostrongylus colubriformis TaxID=6319 RepID=A0AAN8G3D5_TRICO
MGRASFEYDEVGNTFYYVLVSFYAIILLPATYFFFPTGKAEQVKVDEHECQCHGCVKKRQQKEANRPWKRTKKILTVVALLLAWVVFALIVKKVTEIEVTHEEYNPYQILGLDQGADSAAVRKAYRELSKKLHPDRGGDAQMFDKIAKAYQALTDEESRENWEKYGNPDGPTATTFGIALPKWLVSKEYGLWVLAFYGLLFMVILPVAVGVWWYNSIKYNVDKVLLDTTQLFYYFLHKTPKMEINRMLMLLGGAFEFWKQYNKEVIERETDDVELTRRMKSLPNLGENKKERPLSLPYSLKARILIHSYLNRIPLDNEGLEYDQRYVLLRVLRLIEEMISISQQLTFYTQTKVPIETLDNLLRLQPMFVQGLWPKNSPLLQLPHITDHHLPYLRKGRVFSCGDLAAIDGEKRRALLKSLSDEEYRDVLVVLSSMPRLSIQTTVVVEGEDDAFEVTAGCVVTIKVSLQRSSLLDPIAAGLEDQRVHIGEEADGNVSGSSDQEDEENGPEDGLIKEEEIKEVKKKKPWEKNRPQKKKGGAKKKPQRQQAKKVVVTAAAAPVAVPEEEKNGKENKNDKQSENQSDVKDDDDDEESLSLSDVPPRMDDESDMEDDWEEGSLKKVNLDAKSHKTHLVHCPHFPAEKYEWWWLVLTMWDKKQRRLVCPTVACKTLVDEQTVEMRFAAPPVKGMYNYQLSVRSDSYMDCDYNKDIKLEVKEAKEIVLPKYEDTEDEDEKVVASSDEEYTEGSDSDEE